MTTEHSYRAAMNTDEALNELIKGKGRQFCPSAVEAFVSEFKKKNERISHYT